jgi:YfiR/HmsC-like
MATGFNYLREIVRRCWNPPGFALLLFTAFIPVARADRGESVSKEYPMKAACLLNFAQFTEWPTNAFATPESPFVIGVLGGDPFGSLLDAAVANERVNGRPIVIQRFRRLGDLQTCHILYIGESETRELAKVVGTLQGKPVLTVSDVDNKSSENVAVRFVTENNKIRFKINTDSLKDANLVMSSKLLRVAEIISRKSQ